MINDIIGGLVSAVIGILTMIFSKNIPAALSDKLGGGISPSLFPNIVAILLIILGLWLSIQNAISVIKKRHDSTKIIKKGENIIHKRALLTGLILLFYIALFNWIGFIPSTIISLGLFVYNYGERRWKVNFLLTVLFTATCYYVFKYIMHVPLPTGIFFNQ